MFLVNKCNLFYDRCDFYYIFNCKYAIVLHSNATLFFDFSTAYATFFLVLEHYIIYYIAAHIHPNTITL